MNLFGKVQRRFLSAQEEQNGATHVMELPDELVMQIFRYLGPLDTINLGLSCVTLFKISLDKSLFNNINALALDILISSSSKSEKQSARDYLLKSNLQILKLSERMLSDGSIKDIVTHFNGIEELELTNIKFYKKKLPISSRLKKRLTLQKVTYKTPAISASTLEKIMSFKNLTCLNLSGNFIQDEEGAAIAESLQMNTTITTLDLSRNNIRGPKFANPLNKAIKVNRTLKRLTLNYNHIRVSTLSEGLKENNTLTTLDLEDCGGGVSPFAELAGVLKVNQSLATLNFGYNRFIGTKGALELAKALEQNSTLTTLCLGPIIYMDPIKRQADDGSNALGIAMALSQTLTKLVLTFGKMNYRSTRMLGDILIINHTLTNLVLTCETMDRESAQILAAFLAFNQSLTHLELEGDINSKEIELLVNTALKGKYVDHDIPPKVVELVHLRREALWPLEGNNSLKTFALNSNIHNSLAEKVALALKQNKTLKTLELRCDGMIPEEARTLVKILTANQTLKTLVLNSRHMSPQAAMALGEALKEKNIGIHVSMRAKAPDNTRKTLVLREGLSHESARALKKTGAACRFL